MINHDLIPCIGNEAIVARVQTAGDIVRSAYITDTGTYIKLNEDAVRVLELCNGINTVSDIIDMLATEYSDDPQTKDMTLNFLKQLKETDVVKFLSEKTREPKNINPETNLFSPLQYVYIECTNACNLKCLHCYNDSGVKLKQELTTEEIKEIIDKLGRLSVLNVILTGGEPLLRKDIFEIIEYIRGKPMSVTLFTNGILIDEEVTNKIKNYKILRVIVSLDGANPETHDKFRGVPRAFEKTKNAIRLLAQRGIFVTINTCINKFNKNEIPQILQLIKDLGVSDYVIGPIYSAGRAKGRVKDIGITPEEYPQLVKTIRNCEKQIFGKEKVFVQSSPFKGNCGIGMRFLVIKPDGTLIPCVSADAEDFYLGNVKKDAIEEVWNKSSVLNKLREIDLRNDEKCATCEHFQFCKGGCRLSAYQAVSDILAPDPVTCIYYRCIAPDIVTALVGESEKIGFEVR